MNCTFTSTCPYFGDSVQDVSPHVLAMYRARYCRESPTDCARYLVVTSVGRSAVPFDLHPTDKLRAMSIVRNHERGTDKA